MYRMTCVVGAFIFFSAASQWRGGCWLGLNKGGLTLLIFECQVFDLLHAGLLDLYADEFRSSFWRFSLIDAWRHWISRLESIGSCDPLSSAK
jgi:hypothetical protein